jgi:hypothetical protein
MALVRGVLRGGCSAVGEFGSAGEWVGAKFGGAETVFRAVDWGRFGAFSGLGRAVWGRRGDPLLNSGDPVVNAHDPLLNVG